MGVQTLSGSRTLGWASKHPPRHPRERGPCLQALAQGGHPRTHLAIPGVQTLPGSPGAPWAACIPPRPPMGYGQVWHAAGGHPGTPMAALRVQHPGAAATGLACGVQSRMGSRTPGTHAPTPAVTHTLGTSSHPATPDGVRDPRGQTPGHPSGANPAAGVSDPWMPCKEAPPDFPGLSLLSHFVPRPNIAWLVCVPAVSFWGSQPVLSTHLFPTPRPLFPPSPNPHFFYVKPRGQREITSPDSLRKSSARIATQLCRPAAYPKFVFPSAVLRCFLWWFGFSPLRFARQHLSFLVLFLLSLWPWEGIKRFGPYPHFSPLP